MPAKMVGSANWELQPGYPKLTGTEDDEKITVQYLTETILLDDLPEYGTVFYDERWPFFNAFENLVLSERSVHSLPGEIVLEISLTYSESETQMLGGDFPVREEVSYQALEMAVPIEQLTGKYKTKWNYGYAYDEANGDGRDILTYYAGATDTKIPESLSNYVIWVKPGGPIPKGWFLLKAPTKPGVEVYKTSVPVVNVRRLSRSKHMLEKIADKDNTKQNPPDTFGYTGEWLQSGSSVSKEGLYWVLTTQYTGSKDIDDDIYD